MYRTGRLPRIHEPNTIHHVMIRGNNRQRIFFNEEDFNCFLKILEESAKKYDHKVLAFCLMSNHAHLLIRINDDSLSIVMKNINYRYARWLNHKKKRIGHLFQGRYRSIDVRDEKYLINLCRYIHFNPVEAKIVTHPSDYPWSSHLYYCKNNPLQWMDTDLMLTAIKNKTAYNYQDFIEGVSNLEQWKPALFISESGECVINEDVVRNLNMAINNSSQKVMLPEVKFLPHAIVSSIVCKNLNISYDRLLSGSRDRKISSARIFLASCWLAHSNLKITDIVKLLNRTHGTLLRQLNQLKNGNTRYFSENVFEKIYAELRGLDEVTQ